MTEDYDTEGKDAFREPPDSEELEAAIDDAVNPRSIQIPSTQKEERAQILQTQQLLYDIDQLNRTLEELNTNLEQYTFWSRLLTIVLVLLGLLSLIVNVVQLA